MIKDTARLASWLIPLAILVVYLCFPTKQYFFDGVAFAQAIEDATALDTSLIHPNHLFYEVFGCLVYKTVQAFGLHLRALPVLQITNSILSAFAAYLFFHILRLTLRSLYLSCALTLLFAFSATWWKFSTDANAYIPSVLFVLVSFYLILPARKARPLLLALAFSLSMCFHQLAVIFFPVLVFGLYLQAHAFSTRQRVLIIVQFSLAAFVITFGSYYYCFYLATGSLDFRRLLRWMTSFSPDASFSFNAAHNLGYTLRGYGRLFFGGRISLLKGLMNPFIIALGVMLVAAVALLVRAIVLNLKGLKPRWERARKYALKERPLLLLCASWISVYTVFLFIWQPQHTFYRLFYLPALVLLAGLLLASGETLKPPAQAHATALLVAALSLSNFLFLIFPYSHAEKYPPLALASEMNQVWPRGTVVYYAFTNSDNSLFRYINPPTVWKQLNSFEPGALAGEIQKIYDEGGTAWLDVWAIEEFSKTPEGAAWLSAHAREQKRYELIDKAYKIKFVQIIP